MPSLSVAAEAHFGSWTRADSHHYYFCTSQQTDVYRSYQVFSDPIFNNAVFRLSDAQIREDR
jgi:hypothetical protein